MNFDSMNFDLNDSAGEWFPFQTSSVRLTDGETVFDEPVEGIGRVKLRPLTSDIIEQIQRDTTKKIVEHVVNPSTRKMERVTSFDQTPEQKKKDQTLTWDHIIMEWENKAPFLNNDGTNIECTTENKMKLMEKPVFARFVGRCLQTISGAVGDAKAAAEKN